ncbi:hypothetical protein PG985_016138 [Apiospora marii]|uniref:Uncharacterized protein n=1 Tax=Apiospora marii TaxID=335849 RepID=A0ABR1S3M0_9PEZI
MYSTTPFRKGHMGGIGKATSKDDAPYQKTGPSMITPAMTRDSDDDPDHPEKAYAKPPPAGKRAKVKRHFARFWCCYVLAIIIFLAIMLPVLFLKIIPALAQRIVDDTDLPIKNATLKAVSSDLVQVSLTTSLNVPKGLSVGLDEFSLYMYNPETAGAFSPYLSLDMKAMTLSGNTDITVTDQMLRVSNHTELDSWLNRTFVDDATALSVQGATTAHLGALKMPIRLAKTVPLAGLRKLAGVRLDAIKLILPPQADGTNIVGNFTLPNWSILTMDLGNITLDILAGDKEILLGTATIFDVVLPPGNHSLPFRGQLYIPALLENFGGVLSSQGDALASGKLTLGVRGNRTEVDGRRISYLEHVLNNMLLMTDVPVAQLLGDVADSVAGRNATVSLDGLLGVAGQALGEGLQSSLEKLLKGFNLTTPLLPSVFPDLNPDGGGGGGSTSGGGGGEEGAGEGGSGGGLLGQGGLGGFIDRLNITGILNDTLQGLNEGLKEGIGEGISEGLGGNDGLGQLA